MHKRIRKNKTSEKSVAGADPVKNAEPTTGKEGIEVPADAAIKIVSETPTIKGEKTDFVAVHHFNTTHRGPHTRVFDKSTHGPKFAALAIEFSITNPWPRGEQNNKLEFVDNKEAKIIEETNQQKEKDRMNRVYAQRGWLDAQGNYIGPKEFRPWEAQQ